MIVFKILWQFPQTILGLIIVAIMGVQGKIQDHYRGRNGWVFTTRSRFGICLGPIIIYGPKEADITIMHEKGHRIQSQILGPLYLFTVGIVSLFWNVLSRIDPRFNTGYYSRWPEKQADRLGGVVRGVLGSIR